MTLPRSLISVLSSILSEIKTKNTSKLFRKPNPAQFLPKFPNLINIEEWWQVEVGLVLESDIKYVNEKERAVIDGETIDLHHE